MPRKSAFEMLKGVINALSKSETGVFGITNWSDDINMSFNIMLIILLFKLTILPAFGIIFHIKNNDIVKDSYDDNVKIF